MIPGELYIIDGLIELNSGRRYSTVMVLNYGDRPVQVGSHFHFYEVNNFLKFNRDVAIGFRLNIPSGTSIRFEPGQTRKVELVQYSGKLKIFGFCKKIMRRLS
ncbi:urease subunit beta [Candidatus Blochmanniella vafra str. BVAF]|uniref:Urease subunit beta n=1 Tax=Blochmanniella vafra (strain BVAF) TaxID=859654 RepID=E8Q6D8_BLOVB|nr:urease subunit beta [Candidatus Blochmannia vafer]ADV33907.1 urease subunit beta [Candidatus Blochmannia vafer str. BVAF]